MTTVARIRGPAFDAFPWPKDDVHSLIGTMDREFPSTLYAWSSNGVAGQLAIAEEQHTHIGYADQDATLHCERVTGTIPINAGMYFAVPGPFTISGGRGIAVRRHDWLGMQVIGGPVEFKGRLKYIDGCTDSLLIPPVKLGDPCFNLLYFPPGIDQTAHTHPSVRIGLVISGRGLCIYDPGAFATSNPAASAEIDLVPGMLFCIHTNGRHKFATPYGEHMRVVAYHPDSDVGPTDENHPMLRKTFVDGVSARDLPDIHTR